MPPSIFSIFFTEFLAVETALKHISLYSPKHFIIYSDSKSFLDRLHSSSCPPSFISVLKLYKELCNKGYHILLCWVPGHVGITGNKAADKAAKSACTPLNYPVPYSDLKLAITSFTRKNWQREWDGFSENKLSEIKPSIAIWPTLNSRKIDDILTRENWPFKVNA